MLSRIETSVVAPAFAASLGNSFVSQRSQDSQPISSRQLSFEVPSGDERVTETSKAPDSDRSTLQSHQSELSRPEKYRRAKHLHRNRVSKIHPLLQCLGNAIKCNAFLLLRRHGGRERRSSNAPQGL